MIIYDLNYSRTGEREREIFCGGGGNVFTARNQGHTAYRIIIQNKHRTSSFGHFQYESEPISTYKTPVNEWNNMAALRTNMRLSITENKSSGTSEVYHRYKEERLNSLKHGIQLNNPAVTSHEMQCYKGQNKGAGGSGNPNQATTDFFQTIPTYSYHLMILLAS
jgi:hypothetical protein